MVAKILSLRPGTIPTSEVSDAALVFACAAKDSSALAVLFERHHGAVFRFACRLLGPGHPGIDDLVQNTFLEAFFAAGRFRSGSKVTTWLFGIAANLARNLSRAERRQRRAFERLLELPTAPPAGVDDQVEKRELLARLWAALDELPHDLRVVYVLCELEEVPGVEAAAALELRPGTLWRRLHDARRKLRERLSDRAGRDPRGPAGGAP